MTTPTTPRLCSTVHTYVDSARRKVRELTDAGLLDDPHAADDRDSLLARIDRIGDMQQHEQERIFAGVSGAYRILRTIMQDTGESPLRDKLSDACEQLQAALAVYGDDHADVIDREVRG
jgi:hypothetical protein